jgi:hypothetical protein
VFFVAAANGTKVMFVDVSSNLSTLATAGFLIEAEMYPAVHSRVVDVVGEIAE